MYENDSQFSGIPALGDTEGLNNYMNGEALRNLGIPNPGVATEQPDVTPTPTDNQSGVQPVVDQNNQGVPTPTNAPGVSREEFDSIVNSIKDIQESLQKTQQQQVRQVYTPQQLNFINAALQRGYSMEQIIATLQKNTNADATTQKVAAIENYLKQQQYEQAKTSFIDRMTSFGDKWGLSEQDLVTFGQQALKLGINVATVTDLEAVFRAVYPEQYAIRSQRMQNTPSSQIYGGTNMSEGNRTMASRAEDAYVENFLAHTMPNMYNTSKK